MPLAISGGTNVWYEIQGNTRNFLIEGIKNALRNAGWALNLVVQASSSFDYGAHANFTEGDSDTQLDSQHYTFTANVATGAAYRVKIGATLHDSLVNLKAAVNNEAGAGTLYTAATPQHPTCVLSSVVGVVVTVLARGGGPGGNGIVTGYGVLWNGGYKLLATSPQALQVILYIFDDSTGVQVQMISALDGSIKSNKKPLAIGANRKFRVIANKCQFFVYIFGVDHLNLGSCVMGGIPFCPPTGACSGETVTQPVTECWWIMADGGNIQSFSTLRVVFAQFGRIQHSGTQSLTGADGIGGSDACFNGALVLGNAASLTAALRCVCLTPGYNINVAVSVGGSVSQALNWDNSPIEVEPLLAWGDASNSLFPRIRGQIWDAWIRTDYEPMDQQNTFDGQTWVNFTDRFQFGSLQLFVPPLQSLVELNAAY